MEIRQGLAEGNPQAFAPDLAASLNNLAVRQSEVGDRAGALASITRAVEIYQGLAEGNPQAFAPNLAGSLNNLANRQSEVGDRAAALDAFEQAAHALTAGPAAEILLARASWRAGQNDADGAFTDIAAAAGLAAAEPDPRWAGRARQAVQAAAGRLIAAGGPDDPRTAGLPAWVLLPLPDETIAALNAWLAAGDWAAREAVLRTPGPLLVAGSRVAPDGVAAVDAAIFLHPELTPLRDLRDILVDIADHGAEPVLAALRAGHTHAELVRRWLATPTWTESRQLLRDHPGLATDPRTAELLQAGADDPGIAQHLGILSLAGLMSLDDVYDAVVDPTMAADAAMAGLERGDVQRVVGLLHAAPALAGVPFVAPYLFAALAVLMGGDQDDADISDEPDPDDPALDPAELIAMAADQGTDTQREAGAARLRRLARRLPDHAAALDGLARILTAPVSPDPVPEPATDAG
ncbi:MAG TPA: tetratricopeptide repeat protein [Mycobacteriales bacterium]|nr:tetratricopeptide repeat protein [Mycobacteriales bacterium]